MLKTLLVLTSPLLLFAPNAWALSSRCDKSIGDWPAYCDLPEAPGTRCLLVPGADNAAKYFCAPEADGCAAIGGCFGDVPPGSWYPIGFDNRAYKCRCGCFGAPQTTFLGPEGEITGQALIDSGRKENFEIESLDDISHPHLSSLKAANSLMFSKSSEKSYRITTETGKIAILSPGHPVLIASTAGLPKMMKKASDVSLQDQLLADTGEPEKISKIEMIEYKENMVNFNIKSQNQDHHIVLANGLLLGDSAWQERLNSKDARVLLRAEIAKELMDNERKILK